MNTNRNYGLYALAAAIAFVGALALGVPVATLAWLAIVGACPLMMFIMMRGMHSDGHDGRGPSDRDRLDKHDHPTGPGRA
ncbi:DUF2933 domain-containing protein [Streptomyces sp. NPDC085524]|uniref:DUF2933 domain-containing protein n=1 Tax=Streptomyces sp. NPDC085524 TaxID=3365728 RepID=UPI0037D6AD00